MKRYAKWVLALTLLSLCATGVLLQFMPARVPMHMNVAGELDRIGSKYELLLLPALTALCGGGLLALARFGAKHMSSAGAAALSRGAVIVTAVLTVVFLVLQWRIASGSVQTPDGMALFSRIFGLLMSFSMGAIVIVLSNLMPKAGRNALFGLRTRWSGKNDRVWQKCQRFGGWTGVLCGILIIVSGAFLDMRVGGWVMLGLIAGWSTACIIASYRIWRRDVREHPEEKT